MAQAVSILIIGCRCCGTGPTAISHAPYVKHIHAIDISANMIDIARTKAAAADISNVVLETNTLDEFGAAPESFDVVLGLSVLHLLADRNAAIAKVFTLLKPGGVFISSTACIADTMAWIKYLAPIGRPLGMMLKIFSADELRSSLKNAGFEIVHQWQKEDSAALFLIAVKPVSDS